MSTSLWSQLGRPGVRRHVDRLLAERPPANRNWWLNKLYGDLVWAVRRRWPRLPPGLDAVQVATWIAVEHPEYTLLEADQLWTYLSALDPAERTRLELAGGALVADWAERLGAACAADAAGHADFLGRACHAVATETLSAHEVSISHDAIPILTTIFGSQYPLGAAARLLRGVTTCAGMAQLVLEVVASRSTRAAFIDVDHHALAEVMVDGVPVLLDPQAVLPPFTLDAQAQEGILDFDTVVERYPNTDMYVDRVLPRTHYERSHARVGVTPLERPDWPEEVHLDPADVSPPDPWGAYLRARALHVGGAAEDDVLAAYDKVARLQPRGPRAELAVDAARAMASHLRHGITTRRRPD